MKDVIPVTPATDTAASPAGTAAGTGSSARARNPRGQGDRLREDLLDAAADLLAQHGSVEPVSLRAVAKAAGVSPMAVYNHFDDKAALLDAAVDHCWHEFRAALAAAYLEADDPFDRLRQAGFAYVDFALGRPGQYRVLFSVPTVSDGDHPPAGLGAFDDLVAVVADILTERNDDRDPRFVAVQVHTWIHGIVGLIGCHPEGDWPEVEDLLEDLLVRLGLDHR